MITFERSYERRNVAHFPVFSRRRSVRCTPLDFGPYGVKVFRNLVYIARAPVVQMYSRYRTLLAWIGLACLAGLDWQAPRH